MLSANESLCGKKWANENKTNKWENFLECNVNEKKNSKENVHTIN